MTNAMIDAGEKTPQSLESLKESVISITNTSYVGLLSYV